MGENRIPKTVFHMNLETTRPRGRQRNTWQNEVTEDGRIGVGDGWQKKYTWPVQKISDLWPEKYIYTPGGLQP
jgi:hypothetical protein